VLDECIYFMIIMEHIGTSKVKNTTTTTTTNNNNNNNNNTVLVDTLLGLCPLCD
jgi:hypothetical protein